MNNKIILITIIHFINNFIFLIDNNLDEIFCDNLIKKYKNNQNKYICNGLLYSGFETDNEQLNNSFYKFIKN